MLKDVVDIFIKDKFGFGEREFVLSNEVGILYDVDEIDNLLKKLSELGKYFIECVIWVVFNSLGIGVVNGSFFIVMDEDDDDIFVNVVISI